MASNKKAQILAAVMCASSIFGSYTVVSAAESSISGNNSSVVAGDNTITATAGEKSQQSTISLKNSGLSIDVGKQTTEGSTTYGTFTLNSSNLTVNNSSLTLNNKPLYVKNNNGTVVGSISNTGVITGTGLTIKNGTTTLASLNNSGLIEYIYY
ncbi:MAG: hypothetical protein SO083_03865 [Megamonas funiformis]|uniref:hypothetical protein n=1 Tax=Megamonas funiformis TaxID=437897 RepID=UPI002A826556|nr:hypothetical protein [Megamonas funiformis]MDY3874290.1 hypothetical protein [Megamonas funiformis]